MADNATKRIRIAVAVTIDGDWIAYGSSYPSFAHDDARDERSRLTVANELRDRHLHAPYRINMVEADVILPILENKEVVVPANE